MITVNGIGGIGELRKLVDANDSLANKARKIAFARRLAVDDGEHAPLIRARIAEAYETPVAREAIGKHVSTDRNVQRQIIDAVATPYNNAAVRSLRGATPEQLAAWRALYRSANVNARMEAVGRYAVLCNVVHVLPRFEVDGVRLVVVLPHCCDVVFDPKRSGEQPSVLVYESKSDGADLVVVDSEAWRWVKVNPGSWVELAVEPHGLGRRPWVAFRSREPSPSKYWSEAHGQELAEGTIDIARIAAHMAWVRKIRAMKTVMMKVGSEDDLPSYQSANGETPILLRGSAQVGMAVLDPETDPANFLADIASKTSALTSGFGLNPSGSADHAIDAKQNVDALAKHRARQIKHYTLAETELAELLGLLGERNGLVDLRGIDIADAFSVRFAPMVSGESLAERVATAKELQKQGATSPYRFYQELHPELTDEEARRDVDANVEAIAEFTNMLVTRGLAVGDGSQLETLSQQQGRLGGQLSAQTRAANHDPGHDSTHDTNQGPNPS